MGAAQRESGFVWSVLGAIASATDGFRVGTGVTAPIHRMHPLVIAHAAATIETLMPGRFFLGLGTGERLNEAAMGEPWPPPLERRDMLCEAVDIIRALWARRRRDPHHRALPPRSCAAVLVARRRPADRDGRQQHRRVRVSPARSPTGCSARRPIPSLVSAFELANGAEEDTRPRWSSCTSAGPTTTKSARQTIRDWWPNGGVPGPLLSELSRPTEFDALVGALDEATPARPR